MSDEELGSLAEETAKLIGTLAEADSGHRCPHSWCPVCQLTEYIQDNPEIIGQITESAAGFFASVRQVLEQLSGSDSAERDSAERDSAERDWAERDWAERDSAERDWAERDWAERDWE